MKSNLKKTILLLAAAISFSAVGYAQVDLDMSKVFNVTETPVELYEAVAKVHDGIVFIGDILALPTKSKRASTKVCLR